MHWMEKLFQWTFFIICSVEQFATYRQMELNMTLHTSKLLMMTFVTRSTCYLFYGIRYHQHTLLSSAAPYPQYMTFCISNDPPSPWKKLILNLCVPSPDRSSWVPQSPAQSRSVGRGNRSGSCRWAPPSPATSCSWRGCCRAASFPAPRSSRRSAPHPYRDTIE